MKKKLIIIAIILIILSAILYIVYKTKNNNVIIDEGPSIEELSKRPDWMKRMDNNNNASILLNIFDSGSEWNDDKYPISKHFKKKYKYKSDVNKDFDDDGELYAKILSDSDQTFTVFYNLTKYYYKYFVNKYGELDDFEYIREVKYKLIKDDQGFDDYVRADNKIEIHSEGDAMATIQYMINPQEYFEKMASTTYVGWMKGCSALADNCKIVNMPDMNKMPEIISSCWYGIDYDVEDETKIYSKDGFPYLVVWFDDIVKKWEVKYHVNDEYFFDYIEFVEVEPEI